VVREHARQVPAGGLGDKRRMVQGMSQFPQPGPPQTVVPGKKRLSSSLVGGLPRSDLHRINVTATEKGTIVLPPKDFRGRRGRANTPAAVRECDTSLYARPFGPQRGSRSGAGTGLSNAPPTVSEPGQLGEGRHDPHLT
jgi:hypothetical protein